jgi:hypothetical protein
MPRDDERMGAFDAVMWGVETDPLLRSVIVVLLVLDREPDREEALARVERMSLAVPRLRQRVIGNPMSLVPPRWETDPNFDLEYHLRWFAVPEDDGTLRPALTVAEKLAEQDFDRDRPLWEMVLLTGLPEGRAAVLVKMHHAITDGMGGMAMAAALFSLSRDAAMPEGEAPHVPRAQPKDGIGRFVDGVEFESRSMVSGGVRYGTGAALRRAVKDARVGAERDGVRRIAQRLLAPATSPMSATLRDRSLSLHFAVVERPLADLKRAARPRAALSTTPSSPPLPPGSATTTALGATTARTRCGSTCRSTCARRATPRSVATPGCRHASSCPSCPWTPAPGSGACLPCCCRPAPNRPCPSAASS